MNISAYIGRMMDALGWRPQERQLVWARAADSRTDIGDIDRMRLVALARKLYLNNAIVKSAITDIARYSIGGGIRILPRSGDPAWDQQAKHWWHRWQHYPEVSGKYNFQTLQLLISETIDRDGEIFLILTKSKDGRSAQLQVIEGHRVQTPPDQQGREDTFDGVVLDKLGRPKAYWILTGQDTYRKVDAEDMIHVYEPERVDQVRGYPRISVAINTCLDRDELLRLEMQATKAASTLALIVKSKNGGGSGIFGPVSIDQPTNYNGDTRALETIWGGGAIIRARQDQDISGFKMERPNSELNVHLDQYIRAVCLAFSLPYEFIWDPSRIGGANTRLILAKAQRKFEQRQQLIKSQVLHRVWRYAAAVAIKNGDLPATENWHHFECIYPRSITVDQGRQAASDIALLEAGLMTRAEYFGAQGLDWEEEMAQIELEKATLPPITVKPPASVAGGSRQSLSVPPDYEEE